MASSSRPNQRANNFLKAQLAAEAGSHGHAFRFMMEVAQSITPWAAFTPSERNLLLSSLRNYFQDNLKAWYRTNLTTKRWEGAHLALAQSYARRLADEILSGCEFMKPWISRWLALTPNSAFEAKVFYLTFNADVCSYFAELVEDKGNEDVETAIEAYKDGRELAERKLTWLNPVRLMLALHTAQFYSDVMEETDKGVNIADEALTRATEAGEKHPEGLTEEVNELLSKLRDHIATNKEQEDEEGPSTSQAQLVAGTSLVTQVASTSETGAQAETSMALKNAIEASGHLTEGGFMEELNELFAKVKEDFSTWGDFEQDNAAAQLAERTSFMTRLASPSETGPKAETSMDLENAVEAGEPLTDGGWMKEINDILSGFRDDFDTSRKYDQQENSEAGTSQLVPGTSLMTEVASSSETVEKAETSGTSETRVTPLTESGEKPPMASPPPPPPPSL